jgi:hypothetical protein
MALQVVNGAVCVCSCGTAPSSLVVLPVHRVMGCGQPAANILDHIAFTNVQPFGLCTTGGNPAVAAALMVPQPCTPVTPSPWVAGAPTVLNDKSPTLNNTSKLFCSYSGVISITSPGQGSVFTP